MTLHLDDEALAAWASNELTPDERERAIEHAAGCDACRTLIAHVFATPVAMPAKIGRYEIVGSIGSGGMGVVLRGRDRALGRDVAIKMVKSALVEPAHRERMLREAQAMAKISHRNVVTVHELGEAGEEVFVAMELVTGTMLHRWLADTTPSFEARIAVALGIGRGIEAVHAAGLLHRDIKPDNILVREDGTPVLVDFGLARDVGSTARDRGSGAAGTPRYLAPEVTAGAPPTAASDQYQWWTIVDEMLAPHNKRVAAVIERGRAADPDARYPTMVAAIANLEAAVARRRPGFALVGLGVGAATVAALWFGFQGSKRGPTCKFEAPPKWSLERRIRLEERIRAVGIDPTRALAAIDERVQKSTDLRQAACKAQTDGASTEWARRGACVEETWAEALQAFAKIESTNPARTRAGVEDLSRVLPVERCGRGFLPARPEPLEGARRTRYEELAKQVRTLEDARDVSAPERVKRLRAMEPEVRALAYQPLTSRWHWAVGHAIADTQNAVEAAAEYDLAAQAALAAGEDAVYVRALISELHMFGGADAAKVAQVESHAIAGAQRLGNPAIDAELAIARATMYMDTGDAKRGIEAFREADALYTKVSLSAMPMHVAVNQNLAALLYEQGELDAGDAAADRAVSLARERYGENGAEYWETRAARATSLMFREEYAKAEPELRAIAEGLARAQPTGGQVGYTYAFLCAAILAQGRVEDARAECARSVASTTTALGDSTGGLVWPLTLSGQVELKVSPTAALPFLTRAVALAKAAGARKIELDVAQTYLAIALRGAKREAEAMALARQVAPVLADPALAEGRRDFARAFPELVR
jgi:tetratricopeptide (TPR) repeat protein